MTFPRLRTNAIAQYPLRSRAEHATTVLVHVDGAEQRFPRFTQKAQSWIISLDRLTEDEITSLREFFFNVQASGSAFSFTDGEGTLHAECYFAEDEFQTRVEGEARLSTTLSIRKKG